MNQNTNVNLIPKLSFYGNLFFSQYDVGRVATINLIEESQAYTIPTGATVKIQATKPSGLGFSVECAYSGNVVTVVSTETMTNEYGRFPCELRIESGDVLLGTANFTFNVERSPHPEGTTDGTADSVISQITVAFESAMTQIENSGGLTNDIKEALLNCFQKVAWIDGNGQDYYDALEEALYSVEVTGITLNSSSLLFNELNQTSQLTATLIPSMATNPISWSSSDTSVCTVVNGLVTSVGYGNATITASAGSVSATCSVSIVETTVVSLNAVLNGGTFYVGDPVDNIKPYLTVTATWSDSTSSTVPSGSYTLSGSLSEEGTNVITVSYGGQSTTVNVTAITAELVSISAVYTQSGTVYTTDTLDSLKSDLVVTATYSDSSTETVPSADYTLSGTLTVGTSTITVAYGGKTTTFTVTVTEAPLWTFTDGYALSKGNVSGQPSYQKIWRASTSARACGHDPIENKNYVFTVTDSTKYNLAAYDVTNLTKITTGVPDASVDGYMYQCGSKSISWKTSDSVSSSYVWLALKKMDNTAFTDEELANGAEAVFTYTES